MSLRFIKMMMYDWLLIYCPEYSPFCCAYAFIALSLHDVYDRLR